MKKQIIALFIFLAVHPHLQADANCFTKGWRLNPQPEEHVKCNCNCKEYTQTDDYHCVRCGHKRIPTTFVIKKSSTKQ